MPASRPFQSQPWSKLLKIAALVLITWLEITPYDTRHASCLKTTTKLFKVHRKVTECLPRLGGSCCGGQVVYASISSALWSICVQTPQINSAACALGQWPRGRLSPAPSPLTVTGSSRSKGITAPETVRRGCGSPRPLWACQVTQIRTFTRMATGYQVLVTGESSRNDCSPGDCSPFQNFSISDIYPWCILCFPSLCLCASFNFFLKMDLFY